VSPPRTILSIGGRLMRRGWRRLISMRTALVLLFLLAVAAVPGSLLPQRSLNPAKTEAYIRAHGTFGRLLDRLGAFEVFASPWFAAIYLLLGVSLIGCLVPRIRVHAKAIVSRPPRTPRHMNRLPEHDSWTATGEPGELATATRQMLRRWRVDVRDTDTGVVEVAAEKGYLRETGNLLFHVGLLSALLLIAVGRLWHYEGQIILEEGSGFCNTVLNYDSFQAGRMAQQGRVAPFCVDKMNSFTATYRPDGSASAFRADITYSRGADGAPQHDELRVNHPLRLQGDRLYLLGHGYSPKITVRMPNGRVLSGITAAFLPQDALFTSEGAFALQGKNCATGAGTDLGLQGVFAPDGVTNTLGVTASGNPQPLHPVLAVLAYEGDLGGCTGRPHSVYSLDAAQIATGKLRHVGGANLTVGQTLTLPGGARVTFDGYVQWASLQISHDPTQTYLLIAAGAMVAGLLASLSIRRRRLWLRLTPDGDGHTLITVGGLARSDTGNFTTEFATLTRRLQTAAPPAPAPDPLEPAHH